MMSIFQNLNVVEILRVGISGLLFLFSLLAYNLINREQQRQGLPRKGIVSSIYAFMAINFLGAVLVFASGFFGRNHASDQVELRKARDELIANQGELRKAQDKLLHIRSASQPLVDLKGGIISTLPDNLAQKNELEDLAVALRKSLSDDEFR